MGWFGYFTPKSKNPAHFKFSNCSRQIIEQWQLKDAGENREGRIAIRNQLSSDCSALTWKMLSEW